MELKDFLRIKREGKGLSKQKFANLVGISRSYISRLESGSASQPTEKVLLSISYVLDPENIDNTFCELCKLVNLEIANCNQKFFDFVENLKSDNDFNDYIKSYSDLRLRINKTDNSFIELDYPYMDISWLLNQRDFLVFLGHEDNEFLFDENQNVYKKPLILEDSKKEILLHEINNIKKKILEEKQNIIEKKENEQLQIESEEYSLIFDLLKNGIENPENLISRLAIINEDREIFTAQEYHDEINKAVQEQDAIKLQRLIKMTTLKELKKYLSENE